MNNRYVWYFAYGSNLKLSQMTERVGDWIAAKRAQAGRWELVFDVWSPRWNGYTANIRNTGNSSQRVFGAVYQITISQLEALTTFEGRPPSEIIVKLEDGTEISDAKVYVWPKSKASERPPDKYRDAILEGLRQHGYSEEVASKVRTWIESTSSKTKSSISSISRRASRASRS